MDSSNELESTADTADYISRVLMENGQQLGWELGALEGN